MHNALKPGADVRWQSIKLAADLGIQKFDRPLHHQNTIFAINSKIDVSGFATGSACSAFGTAAAYSSCFA